jgi:hypothetical protein
MSEHIGNSFRGLVFAGILVSALAILAAFWMLVRGSVLNGLILAAVTFFAFKWFWRVTLRKRVLLRQQYFVGRRVGTHWVYEELHGGEIESLEFPLEYAGRGEYEIHIAGEGDWRKAMPDWAKDRRAQVLERLLTAFKRSQVHFDPDAS